MNYVVLLGDGMGDFAYETLGGRTPLQAARTPHMDHLAQRGELGLVHTIPPGLPPGSDVGNMSVLGYDPARYYTGRAPIEAAGLGVALAPEDVAYRCNLVRLEARAGTVVLADYSAGHIPTERARQLVAKLQAELGGEGRRFVPGVSYRHLLVWRGGPLVETTTPPHDIQEQPIAAHLPRGQGAEALLELMERARELLAGEPANAIWLWGGGRRPQLPPFRERFGLEGAVVTAVDLVRGLGALVGLATPRVPGATGYLDTNYAGKVEAALAALDERDFVYLHVEAPDEAGHEGSPEKKLQALEDFDARVVGPMLEGLSARGPHAVLLLPDHYTPLRVRTHVGEPVPFVLYRSEAPQDHPGRAFSEPEAARTGRVIAHGPQLMERLVRGG